MRSQGLEIALEWANGPVFVLPAQKPAGEGWRFESLLHRHDGGSRVTIGWVTLDVALSCRENFYFILFFISNASKVTSLDFKLQLNRSFEILDVFRAEDIGHTAR